MEPTMSNSTIALKIAKWCFLGVSSWFALVCYFTYYDTMVWIAEDSTWKLWDVRMHIAYASLILFFVCEVMDHDY